MKRILVTGTAGFIGYHLISKLLQGDYQITGLDNLNTYYCVDLKSSRLKESGIIELKKYAKTLVSKKYENYKFIKLNLEDNEELAKLFHKERFDYVIHLAAQAGVRYSLENPYAYVNSNILGFLNILECCKKYSIHHLIYASSSSVYGLNKKIPFCETDFTDNPISFYAATKKTNELMASTYSYLYNIPITGLRFFTVYGPWGRPDMAYYIFTKSIMENKPIDLFNYGEMKRDFTYVSDIVEGINIILEQESEAVSNRIFNIGNNKPVQLNYFIQIIEKCLNKKAIINYKPIAQGDVVETYASIKSIQQLGYKPKITIEDGLQEFIRWYMDYINKKY